MKSVFSKALTQDGVISEEQISLESLGRSFGPLQQQVIIIHHIDDEMRKL